MKTISVNPEILQLAEKSARDSDVLRSKMCAIALSKNGQILHKTCNVRIFGMKNKWTIHAEERVIARFRYPIHCIVIYRLNGNQTSKPCSKCMALIREAQVRKIVYFNGQNWIQEKVA